MHVDGKVCIQGGGKPMHCSLRVLAVLDRTTVTQLGTLGLRARSHLNGWRPYAQDNSAYDQHHCDAHLAAPSQSSLRSRMVVA